MCAVLDVRSGMRPVTIKGRAKLPEKHNVYSKCSHLLCMRHRKLQEFNCPTFQKFQHKLKTTKMHAVLLKNAYIV